GPQASLPAHDLVEHRVIGDIALDLDLLRVAESLDATELGGDALQCRLRAAILSETCSLEASIDTHAAVLDGVAAELLTRRRRGRRAKAGDFREDVGGADILEIVVRRAEAGGIDLDAEIRAG